MKKIPTLYVRNPDDRRYVTDQVNPGCEWVLAGEGVATRKYDGTCVMFDGTRWWARREVKPGKAAPAEYQPVSTDEVTGKTVGWETVEQSSFAKYHAEALAFADPGVKARTYELIGPKINGNPENSATHLLVPHGAQELHGVPLDFTGLAAWLRTHTFEGIVWHHPDGRVCKLKARDFPPSAGAAGAGAGTPQDCAPDGAP